MLYEYKSTFFITACGSQPGNQPKEKLFKGDIEQNFSFAEVFVPLTSHDWEVLK